MQGQWHCTAVIDVGPEGRNPKLASKAVLDDLASSADRSSFGPPSGPATTAPTMRITCMATGPIRMLVAVRMHSIQYARSSYVRQHHSPVSTSTRASRRLFLGTSAWQHSLR